MILVVVALLISSCTHVVWYGRSDDRRHIVSVIEQGSTQHVRLDMIDGPGFLGVGVDALVLNEGGHLAYPAQVADGWVVIHDGRQGPTFEAIGEVQLRGELLAYTAEKAGKWHVVRGAEPGEGFEAILPGSLSLSPTGRVAFAAQQGRDVFAVIDGKRSTPMDAVGQLRFSTDGTRVGFIGRRQGASFVVLDGVEQGSFENLAELQLGPPDVFIARSEGSWRVFVDGQPGERFERIAGLLTTHGVAYAGRRGKQEWIVDGPHQRGPFTSIKSKLSRDSSGRLIFLAQREEDWVLSAGSTESAGWTELELPAIGGARFGFIGERDERSVVVIDGKELATWEWAGSLTLSADGARYAHLARRDSKTFIILDGAELTFDVVVAGTLAFSKDGRRFGCVTGDAKTRRLFITREDGKRTLVDMEELVAALSRGSSEAMISAPDVMMLRRWVEAELAQ